jgi:hypothetical protein
MASSEYHRKQAEILAGLALTAPDEAKATRFTLLALEHRALVDKREPSRSRSPSRPQPPRADDNRDPA